MELRYISVPSEADIMNRSSTEESTPLSVEFEVSEKHGSFATNTAKAAFDVQRLCFRGSSTQH